MIDKNFCISVSVSFPRFFGVSSRFWAFFGDGSRKAQQKLSQKDLVEKVLQKKEEKKWCFFITFLGVSWRGESENIIFFLTCGSVTTLSLPLFWPLTYLTTGVPVFCLI
jgi:hypothetical protein